MNLSDAIISFFQNSNFDKNYFLFVLLNVICGLFFSITNYFKFHKLDFLKPVAFLSLGAFALIASIEPSIEFYFTAVGINIAMISGITLGFTIGSLISLREKQSNKLDFLTFSYFGLIISLFSKFFISQNFTLFHLFIVFELLTIIGFIFLIIDYDDSNIDFKISNTTLKKQNSKKNIALRYFITHCFSGALMMIGIGIAATSDQSILLMNLSHINYFILSAFLINFAAPFFSFWFVQAYSTVRFSFSLMMLSGITKISIFLFILAESSIQFKFLDAIGVFMMIYGSLMTLKEVNIRKFLCYALISHNGLMLILVSSIRLSMDSLSLIVDMLLFSFLSQNLLSVLVFVLSYNAKEYLFPEIEKNIKKHKFLFIISFIINWIFISMPYSFAFPAKIKFISSINESWIKNSIYAAMIINIFSHLFVFNYRIFTRKNPMFNKTFSTSDFLKNISILFIIIIPIVILYYIQYEQHSSIPYSSTIKYIKYFFSCMVVFFISHKLFTKNQIFPYDISSAFQYFKKLLNFFFIVEKKIEDKIDARFILFKKKLSEIPDKKQYINSYHFAGLFLCVYIVYMIKYF